MGGKCRKGGHHGTHIRFELVSVCRPVYVFGIVRSQFNGDDVRLKSQRIPIFLFFHVRAVAFHQHGASAVAEVAYIVPFTQPLRQHAGVTILVHVLHAYALCDAVAYTSHFDVLFLLCLNAPDEEE